MSYTYNYGPNGRGYSVDENGRISLNANSSASGYVYDRGATGHPLVVDENGNFLINLVDDYRSTLINAVDETFASGLPYEERKGAFVPFKGDVYSASNCYGGATDDKVYKLSLNANGNWESTLVFQAGSGGCVPGLAVVGERLYACGGQLNPSGIVWYTEDGTNWDVLGHMPHLPGANQQPAVLLDMCEFNGELVVATANNCYWGPQPVFRWDEGDEEFKILTYVKTAASDWGWTWMPGAAGGRLFVASNKCRYVNIYDGAVTKFKSLGETKVSQVIEYNGNIYLIADKIYRVSESADGVDFNVDFELDSSFYFGSYARYAKPALVHNGKLWVAGHGMLFCKDNDEWLTVNTAHSGELGTCQLMYEKDDTIYAFSRIGYLEFKDNLLSPGVPQHNGLNVHQDDYIPQILDYLGVRAQYQSDSYYSRQENASYNIDSDDKSYYLSDAKLKNSPEFDSSGVLSSDDTIRSAIQTLDGHVSSGVGRYRAVLASGDWSADGGLYKQTANHNLNERYVIVQYYDPSSLESVTVDHHVLTDPNNVEVWASGTDAVGIIVSK